MSLLPREYPCVKQYSLFRRNDTLSGEFFEVFLSISVIWLPPYYDLFLLKRAFRLDGEVFGRPTDRADSFAVGIIPPWVIFDVWVVFTSIDPSPSIGEANRLVGNVPGL